MQMHNREEIRDRIRTNIKCTEFLRPAPNHRRGSDDGYICEACGSGTHRGRRSDGAVKYYPNTNKWYCHHCHAGGDVIDLYREANNCDYNTALAELAEKIGEKLLLFAVNSGLLKQQKSTPRV